MFYPQTLTDNKFLENFKDIREKYNYKLAQGVYIKKPNAIYPRLKDSKKRGHRSAEEVINDLCTGLIPDPPFTIIYDIMKSNEIRYDHIDDIYYSNQLLSFINLSTNKPILRPKNKLSNIMKQIKEANFNGQELTEISKYVCSLPCGQ